MRYTIHTSEADAKAQQARVTKLLGYPSAGRDSCTGELVNPDTPGASGWTMRHSDVRKHPSKKQWATAAGDDVDAELADPKNKKLTPIEKAAAKAEADAAVELPADWEPKGAKAAKVTA